MIYSPSQNWHWITLAGPDAQDFLHRLTTCDVKHLQVGSGTPGFFLTAQGKIRAYFRLWHYRSTEFAFEFDGGENDTWKQSLLQTIDQYTFAERMTLVDVTAQGHSRLACRWIFAADESAASEAALLQSLDASPLQAGQTVAIDEEIRLCHQGRLDYGRPWITAWGSPARLDQWVERKLGHLPRIETATLEKWRIEATRPRVGSELDASTIPLEAGLIDAIAQAKGCYPGQEVIERIVSLGSPARRLVKVEGTLPAPSPGDHLLNSAEPPAELGIITSVAIEKDHFVALGFIKKIHAKEGLEVRISPDPSPKAVQTARITRVTAYAPPAQT